MDKRRTSDEFAPAIAVGDTVAMSLPGTLQTQYLEMSLLRSCGVLATRGLNPSSLTRAARGQRGLCDHARETHHCTSTSSQCRCRCKCLQPRSELGSTSQRKGKELTSKTWFSNLEVFLALVAASAPRVRITSSVAWMRVFARSLRSAGVSSSMRPPL